MAKKSLGVIGGSGLYDIDGLEGAHWKMVDSPWGAPSDQIFAGSMAGTDVFFLPRHGRGHVQSPSSINYRANIDALKRCGVTDIISLSAVGSLREEMPPGDFVLVDQFIDRTFAREKSFFGPGCVGHVPLSHPTSAWLMDILEDGLRTQSDADGGYHRGGTYVVMEGPQFSTLAESELYRSWGAHVIGMTNMPEAKLAREAEIRYATVAMVTDYDCWHPDHDSVDVALVVRTMQKNAARAKDLTKFVIENLNKRDTEPTCGTDRCLDMAIMTAPDARDPALVAKLDAVAGRVLTA
ncbi:MAG: S-methyl-5'-thioadenosine phosphorylase [Alphaproteobacteria bacterium]|nr:S-methyl-5'-thioadenosine phosphorylase [Alphaproteobacteria bacterium]